MLMKALVGAACIAIIAFVGYYFWNEYRTAEMLKRQAFATDCGKITSNSPTFDEAYTKAIPQPEHVNRLRKCLDFYESGKMPN